jgi:hypothetical protein
MHKHACRVAKCATQVLFCLALPAPHGSGCIGACGLCLKNLHQGYKPVLLLTQVDGAYMSVATLTNEPLDKMDCIENAPSIRAIIIGKGENFANAKGEIDGAALLPQQVSGTTPFLSAWLCCAGFIFALSLSTHLPAAAVAHTQPSNSATHLAWHCMIAAVAAWLVHQDAQRLCLTTWQDHWQALVVW